MYCAARTSFNRNVAASAPVMRIPIDTIGNREKNGSGQNPSFA
jgi:hypothetical protein